jgi:hypothetical protein
MFLNNCWYVVAWENVIPDHEPIVLFHTGENIISATVDR